MGPSGTGKTTLIRLIGGQLTPDQVKVLLDGKYCKNVSSGAFQHVRVWAISKWCFVY
jgi:ABC-type transporter Mla maintaining outer membrane lipid asymmetry ATPase subunit MlaF